MTTSGAGARRHGHAGDVDHVDRTGRPLDRRPAQCGATPRRAPAGAAAGARTGIDGVHGVGRRRAVQRRRPRRGRRRRGRCSARTTSSAGRGRATGHPVPALLEGDRDPERSCHDRASLPRGRGRVAPTGATGPVRSAGMPYALPVHGRLLVGPTGARHRRQRVPRPGRRPPARRPSGPADVLAPDERRLRPARPRRGRRDVRRHSSPTW